MQELLKELGVDPSAISKWETLPVATQNNYIEMAMENLNPDEQVQYWGKLMDQKLFIIRCLEIYNRKNKEKNEGGRERTQTRTQNQSNAPSLVDILNSMKAQQ